MRAAILLAVVGCSTHGATPDAAPPDAPADAAIADPYDRTVNQVLVTEDFIFWSHGRFACSLEDPCVLEGPAVTSWWSGTGHASPRYTGGVGARSIVGTADERFFVTGLDFESMYLVRDRGVPFAFSVPRALTIGPAIDATHVYWADTTVSFGGYTLRRATRDGDGTDATVLATDVPMDGTPDLLHASGYIWWLGSGGVQRVPVTGGAPTTVAPELQHYPSRITAHGDDVYVVSSPSNSLPGTATEIGHIALDGTYTRIVEVQQPLNFWPRFLVATADAVYWSRRDGNVYRAPIAGGEVETIVANDQAGYAFAVLPDKILVEFTSEGFREIAR